MRTQHLFFDPTNGGDSSAECDLQTSLMSGRAWAGREKIFLHTSPVMAVVGGTLFPVKRDTIAQTYGQDGRNFSTRSTENPTQKRSAYHGDTRTWSILLLRTCGKVQVYVYRGIWHAQWVLRALIGDAKIVRVVLDPSKSEVRALFDYLNSHQQKKG